MASSLSGRTFLPRFGRGVGLHAVARRHWKNRAALTGLLDKRILFVTGKGGVGKTSVSLALGLAATRAGKRTIVCEIAGSENAARIFDRDAVGFDEVEIDSGLWTISIDPDRAMREYLELQLPLKAMAELLRRSRLFNYLAAATPGLREMVTMGKIWELALPERKVSDRDAYDLVIVDAPATGHGVGFLRTPATFAELARVGPIVRHARMIARQLSDREHAGVAIVCLPEEMPVNETGALERELEELEIAVERIFMNALHPHRFSDSDADRLGRARVEQGSAAEAAVAAALGQRRRRIGQREQLDRLRGLTATAITELPFIFDPAFDASSIEALSREVDAR